MLLLGNLDDAEEYIAKRRPIKPGLYNVRRIKEKPLPLLRPVVAASTDASSLESPQHHSNQPQLVNNEYADDDDDMHYSFHNDDNEVDDSDSLASDSTNVTPKSKNIGHLNQNSSENQLVPLRNVSNFGHMNQNSSENQLVPFRNVPNLVHVNRSSLQNQIAPLPNMTNNARTQSNQIEPNEIFATCFQWIQQQMTSSAYPTFPHGSSIGPVVTFSTSQRAIEGQRPNTECQATADVLGTSSRQEINEDVFFNAIKISGSFV